MVVPAGGAWLALHVLLLLAATPRLVSMAVTSPSMASSWSGHDDNITAYVSLEEQREQQADMAAKESYTQREDIQVGCRELRAKRYISDGFCTSTKPIKEVVCAGNCLPIRDLPWYAEFVKVWAKSKLREWQCEEDIVQRKNVSLLCRNGDYRFYRIKVVKSCKCKRTENKHNRTAASSASSSGEVEKKKDKRKRKKDRRRRGRKNRRRGEEEKKKRQDEKDVEEEEVDQRQESSNAQRKERRKNRKKANQQGQDRNPEPADSRGPGQSHSPPRDGPLTVSDPSR